MTILETVFLWVLYSSLTSTIIILLVLFIKKLLKNQISSRFCHALWILVLIKLLFPFSLESSLSLFNLFPPNDIHISSYNMETSLSNNTTNANLDNIQKQNTHKNNLLNQELSEEKNTNIFKELSIERALKFASSIWFFVFLLLSSFVILAAIRFTRKIRTFNEINDPKIIQTLNILKENLKIKRHISIYYSQNVKSPFIFGFLNPKICISKDILNTITHKELYYILLHELVHYKRKDLFYNLLEMTAIVTHWFNPMVWFAVKKMRFDRELACDHGVLEILEEKELIQYGMTIIKLSSIISINISKKMLPVYFYGNKNQLERRIIMIKSFKKDSYKISILTIIVFMVLGVVTLTNAQINTVENQIPNSTKEFYLDTPYNKHFITLDRALDFIDFDFKVPDTVLKNYTFDSITLNKDEANIKFFVRDVVDTSGFTLRVSKKELMRDQKENTYESYKDANNKKINKESIVEPMTISNINGTSITIKNTYEWTEKDIKELEKKNTEGIKHFPTKEYVCKYFIWQDEGLWYSLDYSFKSTDYYGDTSVLEVSMDDIKVILSSLKYTKDLKNTNYESESWKDHLSIYEAKDLKHAEKIIGFTPKFPLQLPENFVPTSSRTYRVMYSEIEAWIEIETTFKKESDSTSEIEFSQTKGKYRYQFLSENGYDRDTEIKANTIIIDDTKVFELKENSNTESLKYYLWKKDDIFYKAKFIGKINNVQYILKTLINEPPYFD